MADNFLRKGWVTAKTCAGGSGTTYAYDNSSRLVSTTDALGQTTTYSYDRADLLTGVQYAHTVYPTASVAYAYDPYYSRLISMSDELGTTDFGYVPVGQPGALRQASETGPFADNDTVQYEYDALGRVIQRSTDVETDYTYDPLGRLSQEHNPLGAFRYGYLGDTGQLAARSLMTPSGHAGLELEATYDGNFGDRQLRRLTYRAGGHRLTAQLSYTHSPEHLLTSAMTVAPWMSGRGEHGKGGDRDDADFRAAWWSDDRDAHGHDRDDERDGRGNPNDHDDHGGGWGRGDFQRYGYDGAYRLTAVRGKRQDAARFAYDASGNLIQASSAFSFTATANALNQLATVNGQAWQYDADGQLLSDGTRQYAWDAAGRLIGLIDNASGKVTTYRYDGLGRRLEISSQGSGTAVTVSRYLWCGMTVCQARDGNDVVTTDYFDQGELRGMGALYYVRDQLGSVIGVTDRTGTVLGTTHYGAYGAVEHARGVQPDFGYAGMLRDPDTALNLTMFRAYDPTVGRWLSRDPIGERGGENLYAYVGGDPLNFNDPSGLLFGGLVNAGECYGDAAARYWAAAYNRDSGVSAGFDALMGGLASLWTPDTSDDTFSVLSTAAGLGTGSLVRGAGEEWSHWIPARVASSRGGLIPDWIVGSPLNGNFVSPVEHAMNDIYRAKFFGKDFMKNEMNPFLVQQWNRMPDWLKGLGLAGAAKANKGHSGCGCQN